MKQSSLSHIPRPELVAAAVSIIIALLLLGVKFVAYYLTGSTAIFSDAMEGIVNVAAAGFAGYSLFLAHQPADESHPYGHGKIEFMSAGFEGGMILLAAVLIIALAVEALVRGPHVEKPDVGLVLVAAAGIVNGIVGFYLVESGRRHSSVTLVADGKHLLSDAVTSTVVAAAVLLVMLSGHAIIDPIAAILVALYIAYMGAGLLRVSAAGLMDQQDAADETMLRGILDAHLPGGKEPVICSYHKLRHRHNGRYHWVDFHLVVPAGWDVKHGHEVASAIEYEIEQALREGNATAHVEPCAAATCERCLGMKE